jgi:uncharacterized membrane protein YfcA
LSLSWLLIVGVGLFAGAVSGLIGFGGTTILLPLLTLVFGAKAAVPIMAVAAVLGNLSRVAVWWREVDWRAALLFGAAAAPSAALGARTMVALAPRTLELCLGVFFVAMIPLRRWLHASRLRIGLPGIVVAGLVVGYLTGIVANTGPINTPFFLAYGLTKGAFVGTEAMGSLLMFLSKAASFQALGALPWEHVLQGLVVGASLMAGVWLARRLMHTLPDDAFRGLMDVILLVTGLAMVIGALA